MAYFWTGETQYTAQPSGSSWVYYLCVKELSTNQEANTSYVGFGLGVYRGASQYDYITNGKWTLTITANGISDSSTSGWINRAAYTGGFTPFTTLYLTIPHNDDGSGILNITYANFDSVGGTNPPDASLGGMPKRITLTAIPRDPCVYVWSNNQWNKGKPYTYYNKEGTNLGWVKAKGKQIVNSDTIEGVAVWVGDEETGSWKTTVTKG